MKKFLMIVLMIAALPLGMATAEESAVHSTERPWGHSFVPRSARPTDIVRVVPMQGLSGDEQVALCCLQGLLARKRPLLWLERSAELDGFWLTWHQKRGYTSWRHGKDGFLKEVHEQVGSRRPAFVNGFLHCWTFSMDDIVNIHADAGPEVVFVTPSQLAALHGQASRP